MNEDFKILIDSILNFRPPIRTFETEHFIYWIFSESYFYSGNIIDRDEFQILKNYTTKYGITPSVELQKKMMIDNGESKPQTNDLFMSVRNPIPEHNTDTYSEEEILRYSKTYSTLEYYQNYTQIKAPYLSENKRMLVMKKKHHFLTVNKNLFTKFKYIKNYRWLSIKNKNLFNDSIGLKIGKEASSILIYYMIRKDWVRDLGLDEYFMISNKNSRIANSLKEAISIECGCNPTKSIIKFFNNDINEVLRLYSIIEPNKIHYITNFIKNNTKNLERISVNNYLSLLFYYFLTKDNRCDYDIFSDYIRMLFENKMKINLNISSYSTIKRKHDELSKDILLKLNSNGTLGVKRFFPNIKPINGLEVEKIRTTKRLIQESSILHHCVHSYKSKIKSGECAIYSIIFDSNRYTLQLKTIKKEKNNDESDGYEFYIAQLRGKYNCNPPDKLKPYLDELCKVNNIKTINESSVNIYFNHSKKNKNIIQLGDKILDNIDSFGNINRLFEEEEEEEDMETSFDLQNNELPF